MATSAKKNTASEKQETVLTFEAGLAQLEALVGGMEAGALSLEQALTAYEQGMALHAQLSALLKAGERRIEMLQEGSGQPVPFEVDA